MDSPVTNDLSSSSNTSGTMTNRRSITIKSRRNSSRISTRSSSNPRNPSSLRGRISKTPTLPRKHVKTTKKNDTTNGFNHQKHSDSNVQIDNNQPMENENVSSDSANVGSSRENACDVSVASDDTVIDHVTIKKRKENKVMNHFTYNTTNEKYKCSICKKVRNFQLVSNTRNGSGINFVFVYRSTKLISTRIPIYEVTLALNIICTNFYFRRSSNEHQDSDENQRFLLF